MSNTLSPVSFGLTGKTAFITGGMRGIGFAVGAALAQHGAYVVIGDVDATLGEEAAAVLGGQFTDRRAWCAAQTYNRYR